MNPHEAAFQVSDRIRIPWREIEFSYARSSGTGGQNVNKTNSKATLRWRPRETTGVPPMILQRFLETFANRLTEAGDLVISSDVHRDQIQNRNDCLQRLAGMLRSVERPPKVRKATKPTKSSQRRRVEGKRLQSDKKSARRRVRSDD